jgi:hypothetical protein
MTPEQKIKLDDLLNELCATQAGYEMADAEGSRQLDAEMAELRQKICALFIRADDAARHELTRADLLEKQVIKLEADRAALEPLSVEAWVFHDLDRVVSALDDSTNKLMRAGDYSCQFPESQAAAVRIAIEGLKRAGGKLTKPAQIGNGIFEPGIPERLVIERAQREYLYQQTPEKEAERLKKVEAFVAEVNAVGGQCATCGFKYWEYHGHIIPCPRCELERVEKLVYVPGVLKCAKCSCVLVTTNLHVNTGQVSANNDPQQCPNGCGPMWRRTERDAGNELCDRLDKAVVAEKENGILRGLVAKVVGKCVYCGLEEMAKCARGFPGCAWADDLMCGEDEAFKATVDRMRKAESDLSTLKDYKACTELALSQVYRMFDPPLVGTPGLKTKIVALRAGQEGLHKYALMVLEESRDDLCDLDGGWLQDKAEECGLLVRVNVTEPCGEICSCAECGDFPQDCLRYSAAVQVMVDALPKEGA